MAEAADTSVGIADADGVVAKLKGNGVLEKLRTQAIQRLEHDVRLCPVSFTVSCPMKPSKGGGHGLPATCGTAVVACMQEGLRHSIEQAVRSSKTLASWSEKQPNRQLTSDLHSELGCAAGKVVATQA